ncbi:alpha/beta hydrolase [Nocardia spumae]|uniref:alpha/beta hydrolase n=1 Tax=Nocardia spumae TaxID=2887190 RepID=UPI001D1562BB|nr:alpha/beta fold hydrolase [Nocardia spumae]
MPYFQGARGRLHYRCRPSDSADPVAVVVFLPGSGQHSGHYHRFGRALGRWGIETRCLDTAGQGLSEGDPEAPGTLTELAADAAALAALTRAERPGVPFFLAGHSLGAASCLVAAGLPELSGCAGSVLTGTPKRALDPSVVPPPELPVLALHGVDDRRAPIDAVRDWAARHRSVGLHEYADAGHDLLHEPVHAAVTADIAEWIRAVADRRHGATEVG